MSQYLFSHRPRATRPARLVGSPGPHNLRFQEHREVSDLKYPANVLDGFLTLVFPSKNTFISSRRGGKRCVLCVLARDCVCVLCVCMCVLCVRMCVYVYVRYVCMWGIQLQNLGTFSVVQGSGMCIFVCVSVYYVCLCSCVYVVCMCYVCVGGIQLQILGTFSIVHGSGMCMLCVCVCVMYALCVCGDSSAE